MSQEPVLWSAHPGQEDDLGDSEATGSTADETILAERFVKIIEKPKSMLATKAPDQRPELSPEPKLAPILPEESLEPVRDILDYGLLTKLFEGGSSRSESAAKEPAFSRGFWAMLGAAALSTRALRLAITVTNRSLWRRVERSQRSKLPDFYKVKV